jgi:hypothetical protein
MVILCAVAQFLRSVAFCYVILTWCCFLLRHFDMVKNKAALLYAALFLRNSLARHLLGVKFS